MVKPAAPVTSTSSAKSKKPKKPTTKPPKEPAKIADAASSSDDAEAYSELIAREESPDPPLANVPPAGSVPADLDVDVDFGEFDYDAMKAEEGTELWLVRAPIAVRPLPVPLFPLLLRKKKEIQVKAKNLQEYCRRL